MAGAQQWAEATGLSGPSLVNQVRRPARLLHMLVRTEKAYVQWMANDDVCLLFGSWDNLITFLSFQEGDIVFHRAGTPVTL